MEKPIFYINKIFRVLVAILVIGLVIFIIGALFGALVSLYQILAYNFSYVIVGVIIIFLSILNFDVGEFELLQNIRSISEKKKLIFTSLGFILIIVLFLNPKSARIYVDGQYCALVNIYNPDTGNDTTSKLLIEVDYGRIMVIHFNNGGWLDSSHFDPDDSLIDNDGEANFVDDRDREFDISIIKRDNCN